MKSPAPISSSSESDTCATTSALRRPTLAPPTTAARLVLERAGKLRPRGLNGRSQAEKHAGQHD